MASCQRGGYCRYAPKLEISRPFLRLCGHTHTDTFLFFRASGCRLVPDLSIATSSSLRGCDSRQLHEIWEFKLSLCTDHCEVESN